MRAAGVVLATQLVVACVAAPGATPGVDSGPGALATPAPPLVAERPVRVVLIGDLMLGRGVADVAAHDPGTILEQLRPVLADADIAMASLESALTARPHAADGSAMQADPGIAPILAGAGLDAVTLANDHATDGGPAAVLDTVAAVATTGVLSVGAGTDATSAAAPLAVDAGGVRVGILAFDMTGEGAAATGTSPGVNPWDRTRAMAAVSTLRADVDLLIVALHGGTGDLRHPNEGVQEAAKDLAGWGVDVVWGQGANVAYPPTVIDKSRPAVLALGLGDAVTDERRTGPDAGTVLEVMADAAGVLAMRTGTIDIDAGRAAFTGWHDPAGDAVAVRGDWWTPVREVAAVKRADCNAFDLDRVVTGLQAGSRVVAASCGSVTHAGATEMVIAYRHPVERKLLQGLYPGRRWADADGLSAHLAVMTPDAHMIWAAGTLPDPVGAVVVCSGSVAIGYTTLDDPAIVAAGAWTWRGFGFATAPHLSQPSSIGCADIDHDGATEPLVRRIATTPGGTSR